MKLTVTCECGKEIEVPKTLAARFIGGLRKKQQTREQLSANGKKGAQIRLAKRKLNI